MQYDAKLGTRPTRRDMQRMRSLSPDDARSREDSCSSVSQAPPDPTEDELELDEAEDQDIEELWYGTTLPSRDNPEILLTSF